MSFSGIDVSKHNGKINWYALRGKIDFAIIRAGYGNNNIDAQLENNVRGCEENGIAYGFYWFSYALTEQASIKEANYLCDIADIYHPTYPLCYDWEYDSDSYAKKKGVTMTNNSRLKFAKAFLKTIENRGYYALIYSNADYLNKGFRELLNSYDLWFASWTSKKPEIKMGIWQNSDKGIIAGVQGKVDSNISYIDYPSLIKKQTKIDDDILKKISELEINLDEYFTNKYKQVLGDVYSGKYGNGNTRHERLKNNGYDPELVRALINYIESEAS